MVEFSSQAQSVRFGFGTVDSIDLHGSTSIGKYDSRAEMVAYCRTICFGQPSQQSLIVLKPFNEDSSSLPQTLHLYRGQCLYYAEREHVRAKIGGLMSLPSFLSTSVESALQMR
jgi:hypothetical protein